MIEITLSGTVATELEFSHKTWGEKFYQFYIESARLSGFVDRLPCVVSEIELKNIHVGEKIQIAGSIRSYRRESKLEVYVFVSKICEYTGMDENIATGLAYVKSVHEPRETPLGRIISEIIIKSVQCGKGHFSYIPSIAWERNAFRVYEIERGTFVQCQGRFQSREYCKVLEDGTQETRTAYELSLSVIDVMETEELKDAGM